jgi:hypothetical protein
MLRAQFGIREILVWKKYPLSLVGEKLSFERLVGVVLFERGTKDEAQAPTSNCCLHVYA